MEVRDWLNWRIEAAPSLLDGDYGIRRRQASSVACKGRNAIAKGGIHHAGDGKRNLIKIGPSDNLHSDG